MPARPLITLTTDFGLGSPYVAEMHGVIYGILRDATIVDATHVLPAQQVWEGALALEQLAPAFPAGSIHVAVVDPGVGSDREILYAEIGDQRFIAPDNGLLTLVAARGGLRRAISLREPAFWRPVVSNTFHGRDIMAPVAAHLASGLPPERLGPAREDIVLLDVPAVEVGDERRVGQILTVDRFGNLITNLTAEHVPWERPRIRCGSGEIVGLARTYSERASGELLALWSSSNRLELAVARGSAAERLGVAAGAAVSVSPA